MTVQDGPDTMKQAALKKRVPVVEGLVAGTTKQVGAKSLKAEEDSLVPDRLKKGL